MLRTQQQAEHPPFKQSAEDDSDRAGPPRDPKDSAEALSPIEKQLRESTRRLADLNVLFAEAAGETPGRDILETEFYFARPVVRSAVIYKCASEGGRQYALAWLFEHAQPDPDVHLPAGEVTITADGDAYVSAGCPIGYSSRRQTTPKHHVVERTVVEVREAAVPKTSSSAAARASTPVTRRQRARLVWVPLLLLAILGSSVLAYRNLISPATNVETTAAHSQAEPPTVTAVEQQAPAEPEIDVNASVSAALRQTEEPVLWEEEAAASDDELAASRGAPAPSTRQRAAAEPRPPASRSTLSQEKTAAADRQDSRRPSSASTTSGRSGPSIPSQAPASRAPATAAASTATVPSPAAADPQVAIGATPGRAVETTQPAAKEQPTPPAVAREAQPAPAPAAQKQKQQIVVENTWVTRMRAELNACGRPGLFRNDICREVARWKYCHPHRWHTVAECRVDSFAEPLS